MRLALLAVLAANLAACSSGGGKASAPKHDVANLVPWSDAAIPELAVPTAPVAPPCRAAQLRTGQGFMFQSAILGATGSVELRNVGPAACRLVGRPRVRFVGAPKAPAQRQVSLPAQQPSFPRLRRPAAWLRSLSPGDSASLTVEWRNWCVPDARAGKAALIPPKAARVTLAGGGSLDVDYNAMTGCENPSKPSTIGVHPFEPPILPSSEPWTTELLSAKVLNLEGATGPLQAHRGQLLRYSVTLRNADRGTVRFDKCPFAVELLAPAGTMEAHRLNCSAARPLAPGGTLRFEMRIRIPARAPLGANGLFWELDPLGAQSPEAVARVIVGV